MFALVEGVGQPQPVKDETGVVDRFVGVLLKAAQIVGPGTTMRSGCATHEEQDRTEHSSGRPLH